MSGRNEDILRSMIDGTSYTKEPESRNEELLLQLKDVIEAGGLDPDNYYTKDETDYEITEKVAEIVADAPQDFNTLKEISDWIAGHEDSAAAMNSAIRENTLAIAGKVDKVTGKGLSTEDYTSAEKTKLSGIETGANKTIVDSALSYSSTNPVQNKVIATKLTDYVPKGGTTQLSGNFRPMSNNGVNLGTDSYRFQNIFSTNLYGTNLTLGNALSVSSGGTGCTTLGDFKIALGLGDSAYKGYTSSVTSGSTDLITSGAVYTALDSKVDKETGKGLSTEDYTTAEKTKLAGLSNYDDSALQTAVSNKVDKVAGKGLSTEDFTTAEKTKLAGIDDNATNVGVSYPTSLCGEIFNNYTANIASGDYSHAEGYSAFASGKCSHAEGYHTTASGKYSHAEGHGTSASGDYSHVEGKSCVASGNYSHASGNDTIAKATAQTAIGKYNVGDDNSTYAFIIGNGTSTDARSNAFAVDWNGLIYVNNSATGVDVTNLVEKEQGKGLSTEDFTTAEKNKLAGIEAGAGVNIQSDWEQSDSTADDFIKNKPYLGSAAGRSAVLSLSNANSGLPTSGTVYNALQNKVDKVTGKGLSTEDYTTAEKTKLAGIEDYANYIAVDSVISPISENPVKGSVIYTALNACIQETGNKGSAVDLNNYTATQFFKVTSTQNGPPNTSYGICLILNSSNYIAQFFIAYLTTDKNHHLYVRFNGGSWGNWIQCG